MKIIVDAMGGDNAPEEIVKGCIDAVNSEDVCVILVGREQDIKRELSKYTYPQEKVTIVHAEEVITNDEAPVKAIRTKKNSSMVVGLRHLKEGKGDAFISAGSTGALLTGGLLILGRIKGIDRPALAPIIPGRSGFSVLIDAGANAECKPINLVQFSKMGSLYSRIVLNVTNPKVGLVNIGAEEEKGNSLTKECHQLLKEDKSINFYGNVEGREIPEGTVDVIVCDGFVGNVILKVYEGVGATLMGMVKGVFMKNIITKLSALLVKGGLKDLKKQMDYSEVGGAPFLGVNGVLIKAHGSSKAKAILGAIKQAKKFVDNNFIEEIKKSIEESGEV